MFLAERRKRIPARQVGHRRLLSSAPSVSLAAAKNRRAPSSLIQCMPATTQACSSTCQPRVKRKAGLGLSITVMHMDADSAPH